MFTFFTHRVFGRRRVEKHRVTDRVFLYYKVVLALPLPFLQAWASPLPIKLLQGNEVLSLNLGEDTKAGCLLLLTDLPGANRTSLSLVFDKRLCSSLPVGILGFCSNWMVFFVSEGLNIRPLLLSTSVGASPALLFHFWVCLCLGLSQLWVEQQS